MLEKLTKNVAKTNDMYYNKLAGILRRKNMTTINERIKEFRNQLHLSQEYVAKFLGINRATYTQMENGELFGVTADALLNENKMSQPATVFARSFEKLDKNDQAEIMNLIKFKEQMKMQRS